VLFAFSAECCTSNVGTNSQDVGNVGLHLFKSCDTSVVKTIFTSLDAVDA